jgi:hypothetical protein
LLLIDIEPIPYGLFVVVVALHELSAQGETLLDFLPRREVDVQQSSGLRARPASRQPLHQHVEADIHQNGCIERDAEALEDALEIFCLATIAGIAVQNEPLAGIVEGKPFLDHAENDAVRYELTRVHSRFGLDSERTIRGDGTAQQVPGRHLGNAEFRTQSLCLCSFARARRTEHDDSHRISSQVAA